PGVRYQFSFSFRFGFTISKVMGWTGGATPLFLSSLSSCSLDFFFLFLSLASPRPVGIGPSIIPPGSSRDRSSIACPERPACRQCPPDEQRDPCESRLGQATRARPHSSARIASARPIRGSKH